MKKILIIALILGLSVNALLAQKKLPVAFYNVENLFDTIDTPGKDDTEFTPGSPKAWNTAKYQTKLQHTAFVLKQLNADFVGLCEVENRAVLEDLVKEKALKKKKYGIVHYESPDNRGIDCAFLYNPKSLTVTSSRPIKVSFPDNIDYTSRDILYVKGTLKNGENIHFLVNHFPSRRGGKESTQHWRINVALTLKTFTDSIFGAEPNANIILMGDFNDTPSDVSMKGALRGGVDAYKMGPRDYFNPMLVLENLGEGTITYKHEWQVFDQILMSKNLVSGGGKTRYVESSAAIFKAPEILEAEGTYKGEPFRTYVGDRYMGGYSDHLPVRLYISIQK